MGRPQASRPKAPPAYQHYPRDYRADATVLLMTLEEQGAYRNLIDVEWLEVGLPTDPELLWKLAGCSSRAQFDLMWPKMAAKFVQRKDRLYHPALDLERKKQRKNRKARQIAARARWSKGDANALQTQSLASAIATAVSTDPPNPPLRGGPRILRAELKRAEQIREIRRGCNHEPICPDYDTCIATTVREIRDRRGKALAG